MSLYSSKFDEKRFIKEPVYDELPNESYRTNFRKDFARLIHCPSFRRLSGKTQLYPGKESDFFRNRLSHSLEVAQIAKSIAIKINHSYELRKGKPFDLDTDLVEFAALAHDIGHPPFGHQGEHALDQCMLSYGGFEGNAQTFRIIAKIEKKFLIDAENAPYGINNEKTDIRTGLNLCTRTLASVLKYDKIIPKTKEQRLKKLPLKYAYKVLPVKGYYDSEKGMVSKLKENILRGKSLPNGIKFKTIECSIMDLADDIAYSTYDLEDGLKGGFYHPLDIIFSKDKLLEKVSEEVSRKLDRSISTSDIRDNFIEIFDRWLNPKNLDAQLKELYEAQMSSSSILYYLMQQPYKTSKQMSKDGYSRVSLTSYLVGRFIRGIRVEVNRDFPALSRVYFDDDTLLMVEILKTFNYESMILSPRLRVAEFRGKEIVRQIFESLSDYKNKGYQLMPKDYQDLYLSVKTNEKPRIICDFIAGMTDRYCIEFYGRLKSEDPETIFKPI
jgi:dGTPase